MSFFNWFSGKSSGGADASGRASDGESSGLTRDDRTRPVAGAAQKSAVPAASNGAATAAERGGTPKSHRHAQRELLYAAVREAMIRAGVLSASYKFKVLSLDPRGDQFMVMMDLSQEFSGQTDRLAEIELMIAQSAKSRYNIRVTAVYWRLNELVSVARPVTGYGSSRLAPATHHAETIRTATVSAVPEPVPVAVAAAAVEVKPAVARYEPIQADEVAAFKQALAAASALGMGVVAEASAPSSRDSSRSYTLLTGFEDTEMPESPALVPALSATQYGDLH